MLKNGIPKAKLHKIYVKEKLPTPIISYDFRIVSKTCHLIFFINLIYKNKKLVTKFSQKDTINKSYDIIIV